jgi:hypothetical protein
LESLTRFSPAHPFYYSLLKQELGPALAQIGGNWVPNGLTHEWEASMPSQTIIDNQLTQTIEVQRLRGLDYWARWALDPSSAEIYHYYQSQSF